MSLDDHPSTLKDQPLKSIVSTKPVGELEAITSIAKDVALSKVQPLASANITSADDRSDPNAHHAEPAIEERGSTVKVASEDYSVFTVAQKRAIIAAASFAAWFSPMSGSIYYPALNTIAADLHVSDSKVNFTVTAYLIIQGLAPMMIAGFSDKAGRRPAYMICFSIYIVANLALALQNNYAALLVLRMIQAAGSSGTVALANGVVGDCIVSSDRGQYIAFASIASILGPTVSPLLGGLLSAYLDWHWIFWFLLILSTTFFIPLMLFLPETCRKIVGDASVPPPWTSWNLSDKIRFKNRAARGMSIDEGKMQELRRNHKITIPNPISTLLVIADFESALLLLAQGLQLACFYAISAGAPSAFQKLYGFDDLQISLMFLPIGCGSLLSAFTTGRLIDWNYRRHAKRLDFPVKRNRQTDLSSFPIELVRMQIALPYFFLGAVGVMGYGWMLTSGVSLAGPVVMLFLVGYCLIAGNQALSVLMVDIWPSRPATCTAAGNVARCLLGAAASAAIVPMGETLGFGWAYSILALLYAVSGAGPTLSMSRGIAWRNAKRIREERKAQIKEHKQQPPPPEVSVDKS